MQWVVRVINFMQEQLPHKVTVPVSTLTTAFTLYQAIDLGWRILTGLITITMFYFAWRKHVINVQDRKERNLEHKKKMEILEQQLTKQWKENG